MYHIGPSSLLISVLSSEKFNIYTAGLCGSFGINYLFESYCPKALTTPRAAPELQPRGPETMATVYDP